jgi:hypothetical protein
VRDREPDSVASTAVWCLVFLGLGLLLIANRQPEDGWPIVAAVISFAAATALLFKLLFGGR